MGEYQNKEYLKREIIQQSRHMFVYGYDTLNRTNFLKQLEEEYPLKTDTHEPIVLYYDSFSLPEYSKQEPKSYLLEVIGREYLSLTLTCKIIEKIIAMNNPDINKRIIKLFQLMSQAPINNIPCVLDLLKKSKKMYYQKYINEQIDQITIDEIPIPFLQLEMFIKSLKEMMNIDSYFGIILNKKEDMSILSTKAVNNLIGSRINKDLSIKIAMEPDDWKTYIGNSDQFIECPHDYGIIELDDSYQQYIKKRIPNQNN